MMIRTRGEKRARTSALNCMSTIGAKATMAVR